MATKKTPKPSTQKTTIEILQSCDHPVAYCQECRVAYDYEELSGSACPQCFLSLQRELQLHLEELHAEGGVTHARNTH
jgi:predicted amidophosphoribosyltransferase